MFSNFSLNAYAKIIFGFFALMLVWWVYIQLRGLENLNENFLYGVFLGILPILGAVFGFLNAKKWGLGHSSMGRAVLFLSAGLLTWGIGTLIFAGYNFSQVEVPYPSTADIAYIISWPLWVLGMINLSRATGAKMQLRESRSKIISLVVVFLIALFSYYLLIVVARGGYIGDTTDYIKFFFDLAYPIGDLFILTISLLIFGLSFTSLGGIFKLPILFILFAFVFNYFGDFSFVYTVTKETFFVANWVDLIYTVAFFSLSIGVSLLDPSKLSTSRHEHNNV